MLETATRISVLQVSFLFCLQNTGFTLNCVAFDIIPIAHYKWEGPSALQYTFTNLHAYEMRAVSSIWETKYIFIAVGYY